MIAEDDSSPDRARCVWIVTGVPGAGKTTTARRLAERLPRSAFIEGDLISKLVISGLVPPEGDNADEAERQPNLSVRNQALLARSLVDEGFIPVIDWIVMSGDRLWRYRSGYRDTLGGLPICFVVLSPREEVALQRHHARGKYVAERSLGLSGYLTAHVGDLGLWIDNGEMAVDEAVDVILDRQQHAALDFSTVPRGDTGCRQ